MRTRWGGMSPNCRSKSATVCKLAMAGSMLILEEGDVRVAVMRAPIIDAISYTECDAADPPLAPSAVCVVPHTFDNCPRTTPFCFRPRKQGCGWRCDPKTSGRG